MMLRKINTRKDLALDHSNNNLGLENSIYTGQIPYAKVVELTSSKIKKQPQHVSNIN